MVEELQLDNLRDNVKELIEGGSYEDARALILSQHPADQADLVERLDEDERRLILARLRPDQLADVLEYLDEEVRADIVETLPPEVLAPLLERVDEDVAVDIIQDLPREQAAEVLPLLDEPEAFRELLAYPEDSAGGIMSREFVALRRNWTVDESIQFLRSSSPAVDHPFYLYAVDDSGVLIGVVSLRAIVTSAPETPIAAIMSEETISVRVTDDREIAAERMRHYSLLALPVVDDDGRLRGVISSYNLLDVQVEEATEDMYRMVGLTEEESLFRPLRQSVPPRLGWLYINLCTAFLAAVTVSFFQGTIAKAAVLAVFMPVVAGMGGNAGIQTITLVVRSLALGEIDVRDAFRVLRHEAFIALAVGVLVGTGTGAIAFLWKGNPWIGLVVGVALIVNIANATLIGVLVPLGLRKLKADPALAAGVIVTTFTDVVGFLTFLGLATLLISKLT